MMTATFVFALCFAGASAKCEADAANCKAESLEQGLSLFQQGTSRSFAVTARAGADSKSQMSEPKASLLLEDGLEDNIEDDVLTIGTNVKKPTTAPPSDVADPAFYFRICLDILVFLIVMDGVRRYCAMSKEITAEPESAGRNAREHAGILHAWLSQNRKKPAGRRTGSQLAKEVAATSTKLNEAVRASDVDQCAAILKDADAVLTRRILIEPADVWGCKALHLAAESGSAAIVSMLLKRGAQVNGADVWDQTPLHFAARTGSVEVCKTLIDHGALVDAVDAQEFTALHVAAKLQHEATCEFLLDQGAGVHATDTNVPPMLSALLVKRIFKQHAAMPAEF
jgi:hypothetical protein